MTSLILRTATRYLAPIMLLFSLHLLLRGHSAPGGGFSGGLTAASAFALYALAFDVPTAMKLLRIHPVALAGAGLLVAAFTAVLPLLLGEPFFMGLWLELSLPELPKVKLGTPLLFDIGVYLIVVGVSLAVLFPLTEEAP